jgi:ribonuclease R
MKSHEGDVFTGIISNVTSFGMFVELDNTIEGLVRMSSMDDDYYIYNDKQYCLIGERTKKIYKIGDTLTVKLVRADIHSRKIEFAIENPEISEESDEKNHSDSDENSYNRKPRVKKKTIDKNVLAHIKGNRKSKAILKRNCL